MVLAASIISSKGTPALREIDISLEMKARFLSHPPPLPISINVSRGAPSFSSKYRCKWNFPQPLVIFLLYPTRSSAVSSTVPQGISISLFLGAFSLESFLLSAIKIPCLISLGLKMVQPLIFSSQHLL